MNTPINKTAPVVESKEIEIKASPEKVWSIMADIDRWAEWNVNIKNPKTLSEPAVGSQFKWKNNGSNITSTLHTFEPNQEMGWTGKNFAAKAIHNWYLTPTENGTKVRTEESMEGFLMNLMKKKMNDVLVEDMTTWLAQLKAKCEK
ncbi:MAG: SRPBCC domain-containing protein [Flavobacteriia bacterium]|nr:SRPBCC domain-containing protein [Flavobacteriia bacterium]